MFVKEQDQITKNWVISEGGWGFWFIILTQKSPLICYVWETVWYFLLSYVHIRTPGVTSCLALSHIHDLIFTDLIWLISFWIPESVAFMLRSSPRCFNIPHSSLNRNNSSWIPSSRLSPLLQVCNISFKICSPSVCLPHMSPSVRVNSVEGTFLLTFSQNIYNSRLRCHVYVLLL